MDSSGAPQVVEDFIPPDWKDGTGADPVEIRDPGTYTEFDKAVSALDPRTVETIRQQQTKLAQNLLQELGRDSDRFDNILNGKIPPADIAELVKGMLRVDPATGRPSDQVQQEIMARLSSGQDFKDLLDPKMLKEGANFYNMARNFSSKGLKGSNAKDVMFFFKNVYRIPPPPEFMDDGDELVDHYLSVFHRKVVNGHKRVADRLDTQAQQIEYKKLTSEEMPPEMRVQIEFLKMMASQIRDVYNPNEMVKNINAIQGFSSIDNILKAVKRGQDLDEINALVRKGISEVKYLDLGSRKNYRGFRKNYAKIYNELRTTIVDIKTLQESGEYQTIKANLELAKELPHRIEGGIFNYLQGIEPFELTRRELDRYGYNDLQRLQSVLTDLDRAIDEQNTSDEDVKRFQRLREELRQYLQRVEANEGFAEFNVEVPILLDANFVNNLASDLARFRDRYQRRQTYANSLPEGERYRTFFNNRRQEVNERVFLANVLMGDNPQFEYVDQNETNPELQTYMNAVHIAARDFLNTTPFNELQARYVEIQTILDQRRSRNGPANVLYGLFDGTRTEDLQTEQTEIEAHIMNIQHDIIERFGSNFSRRTREGYEAAVLQHPEYQNLITNYPRVTNAYQEIIDAVEGNEYLLEEIPQIFQTELRNLRRNRRNIDNFIGRVNGLDGTTAASRLRNRHNRLEGLISSHEDGLRRVEDNLAYNNFNLNNIPDEELPAAIERYAAQVQARQQFIADNPDIVNANTRNQMFANNVENRRVRTNRNLVLRTARNGQNIDLIGANWRYQDREKNIINGSREVIRMAYDNTGIPLMVQTRDQLRRELENYSNQAIKLNPNRGRELEAQINQLNLDIRTREREFNQNYLDQFIEGNLDNVIRNHPDLLAIDTNSLDQIENTFNSIGGDEILTLTADNPKIDRQYNNVVRIINARARLIDFTKRHSIEQSGLLDTGTESRLTRAESIYNKHRSNVNVITTNTIFYGFNIPEGNLTPEMVEDVRSNFQRYSQSRNTMFGFINTQPISPEVEQQIRTRDAANTTRLNNFNRQIIAQNRNNPDIANILIGDVATLTSLASDIIRELGNLNQTTREAELTYLETGDIGAYDSVVNDLRIANGIYRRRRVETNAQYDPYSGEASTAENVQNLEAKRAELNANRERFATLQNDVTALLNTSNPQFAYFQNAEKIDELFEEMDKIVPNYSFRFAQRLGIRNNANAA